MHQPALHSSAIVAADYDWSTNRLFITFRCGRVYTFYRVPPEVYYGLVSADSAGGYYHAYIQGRFGP